MILYPEKKAISQQESLNGIKFKYLPYAVAITSERRLNVKR